MVTRSPGFISFGSHRSEKQVALLQRHVALPHVVGAINPLVLAPIADESDPIPGAQQLEPVLNCSEPGKAEQGAGHGGNACVAYGSVQLDTVFLHELQPIRPMPVVE